MRRKIVRREKPVPASGKLWSMFVAIIGYIAIVVVLVFMSVEALEEFNQYRAMWYAQNECIAHLIGQGIERSEITRVGYSCSTGE
jgi:hypothetical protein